MDLFDLAKLMWRWRYVTVPLVVLTFVTAFAVSSSIQPEYTSEGSLILVSPTTATTDDTGGANTINPLLAQNSALETTAYVTALAATTPQVRTLLDDEGLSTDYDVAAETRLPIILLQVRGSSREVTTNTALRLVELIDEDLRLRQDAADIPADARVTAEVIGISSVGGADYGGRTRQRIVIIMFGLVATVGVAFALEAWQRHRRAGRNDAVDTVDDGAASPGGSDDAPPAPARRDLSPPRERPNSRADEIAASSGR